MFLSNINNNSDEIDVNYEIQRLNTNVLRWFNIIKSNILKYNNGETNCIFYDIYDEKDILGVFLDVNINNNIKLYNCGVYTKITPEPEVHNKRIIFNINENKKNIENIINKELNEIVKKLTIRQRLNNMNKDFE